MRKIIFVAGIHGVGKTYICSKVKDIIGIEHYKASQLIHNTLSQPTDVNKRVYNIDKNQDALIMAIKETIALDTDFILDGHFCLLDRYENITKISPDVFIEINISAILLLTENIETIKEGLLQRDQCDFDSNLLNEYQIAEELYSIEIAKLLNIPLLKFHNSRNNNIEPIVSYVSEIIS